MANVRFEVRAFLDDEEFDLRPIFADALTATAKRELKKKQKQLDQADQEEAPHR